MNLLPKDYAFLQEGTQNAPLADTIRTHRWEGHSITEKLSSGHLLKSGAKINNIICRILCKMKMRRSLFKKNFKTATAEY